MKQAGKVSPLTLIVVAAVVIGVAILIVFSQGDSPETAATKFMTALATNNVDELTKLSDMGNESQDEVRKQWDFAVNKAAPYYHFAYTIKGSTQQGQNDAVVKIQMVRNFGKPASYEEDMEIPLVKDGNAWKVAVREMDDHIFPATPR